MLLKRTANFIVIAALIVSCFTLQAKAVNVFQFNSPAGLFSTGLNSNESMSSYKYYPNGSTMEETEHGFITRIGPVMPIAVSKDTKISDFIRVEIPSGATLTIEEGVTLHIMGELIIEGTLVNNGKIVIGEINSFTDEPAGQPSFLRNEGYFENKSSINILNGTLKNAGGLLENPGIINIFNKSNDIDGLSNSNRATIDKTFTGHIINTGTINVKNSGGEGIRNYNNAVLDNKGKIYIGDTGTVNGAINGIQAESLK